MRTLIFIAVILSFFITTQSCSRYDRAVKIIKKEVKKDYEKLPKITFAPELDEVIDKNINDIVGYSLDYTIWHNDSTQTKWKAIFNKKVTVETDLELVLNDNDNWNENFLKHEKEVDSIFKALQIKK